MRAWEVLSLPWRNRYITTRKHPVAIATYLMTLLMGAFFLAGIFDSAVLNQAIGAEWQIAWQLLLAGGGAVALAGVFWPQRRLEVALSFESAGAFATGLGLTVYSIVIVIIAGWSASVWCLLAILALGAFARAVQARLDLARLEHLASVIAKTDDSADE